ncbi:Ribose import ATP-binding protein RbsA [compost metagenome]
MDIGAAQFIHQKLLELRSDHCAIVLVSADLNEILELSDSLLVMYEGQIAAFFDKPSAVSEEELGLYMLGIHRQDKEQTGRAVNHV